MNPYVYKISCSVCGGEGMTTPHDFSKIYSKDAFFSHADPRVCADNLRRKEQERKKKGDQSNSQQP